MKLTRSKILKIGLILALAGVVVVACTTIQTLSGSLAKLSPREEYIRKLERSELATTPMVQAWMAAGVLIGRDSIIVNLPFQETGYFASSEPQARFYQFDVQEGQVLTLTSVVKAKGDARVFTELFMLQEEEWEFKEYADTSNTITYEFKNDGSCLVRLQPELLINAFYSITLSVTPVLLNPVKGANNKSIGSFYGDARDGGKRKHEGIDIFAQKGTLVIAPTAGTITKVGTSSLGGKVVWMNDTKRRHSYYFAHLDSQIARAGMKVKQGDPIGTVGNTGNAKYTPSHLHFGVYAQSSKDPVAYIRTMERLVNKLAPDTLFQSVVFRTNQKTVTVYAGPSAKLPQKRKLEKDIYLKVIAQSNDWYRVRTAGDLEGFVEKKKVIAAEKGKKIILKNTSLLLSEASNDAIPVGYIEAQPVETLATHGDYQFIKTQDGLTGWIAPAGPL
jgi:murein DD-endopeptidase MepM/ murein hydrolase activator NlpD